MSPSPEDSYASDIIFPFKNQDYIGIPSLMKFVNTAQEPMERSLLSLGGGGGGGEAALESKMHSHGLWRRWLAKFKGPKYLLQFVTLICNGPRLGLEGWFPSKDVVRF